MNKRLGYSSKVPLQKRPVIFGAVQAAHDVIDRLVQPFDRLRDRTGVRYSQVASTA